MERTPHLCWRQFICSRGIYRYAVFLRADHRVRAHDAVATASGATSSVSATATVADADAAPSSLPPPPLPPPPSPLSPVRPLCPPAMPPSPSPPPPLAPLLVPLDGVVRSYSGRPEKTLHIGTPRTDKLTPTEVRCVFHVDPDSPPKAPKT